MNWTIASLPNLFQIYSDSPFFRPILTLRRVEFAAPGSLNPNIPDSDNMVRTLREIADSKVAHMMSKSSGCLTDLASSNGFATDFMTHVFTLDLDRFVVKLLSDQLRSSSK